MGGATGEAFASTLRSSGMTPEHVLAREAIQNSVDARLSDEIKVEIRFRETRIQGKEKLEFAKALGLDEIAKRGDLLGLQDPDRLDMHRDPKQLLHLVYVEDYNAIGLGGSPHERTSNFYRLLLSLGDRSKARDSEGSGGSYGFGKSVYSANSSIQTIVAYTRWINPKTEETNTRLFGCGYYASHDFDGLGYSGRAWMGASQHKDEDGDLVVSPFEGKAADEMAKKLGFELRKVGQTGTSIMLVDAPIELSEIRRGIENWWWPRLIMGKLDVQLISASGEREFPRPLQRPELRPFIETFKIATNQAPETPGRTKLQRLNRLGNLDIGTCAYSVVELNDDGEPKVDEEWQNSVALIRKPLMVVAYYRASTLSPISAGTYISADEIDIHLKKSEPPEHNKWAPESENLRDKDGLGSKVVERVLHGVRTHMRRFQHSAAPPAPPPTKAP